MGRIHAPELEDEAWFPEVWRDAGTAFLRFGAERLGQAEAMRAGVEAALERSGQTRVVDLCSGGGGPIVAIARRMHAAGRAIPVTMTDLYPSATARALVRDDDLIDYEDAPIDATNVPADRTGLRTMFNAFHHFRPAAAASILRDAVEDRQPIVVMEVLRRNPLALIGLLFVPIATLFIVPFLRPFRWSWLLWTYVVPIIPLFIWWDGTMSVLRAYSPREMRDLIAEADPDGAFEWRVEDLRIPGQPIAGVAVTGVPRAT